MVRSRLGSPSISTTDHERFNRRDRNGRRQARDTGAGEGLTGKMRAWISAGQLSWSSKMLDVRAAEMAIHPREHGTRACACRKLVWRPWRWRRLGSEGPDLRVRASNRMRRARPRLATTSRAVALRLATAAARRHRVDGTITVGVTRSGVARREGQRTRRLPIHVRFRRPTSRRVRGPRWAGDLTRRLRQAASRGGASVDVVLSRDEDPLRSGWRNSLTACPSERDNFGNCDGPKMSNATTRMMSSSGAPTSIHPRHYRGTAMFEGLLAPMHLIVVGLVALLVLGPDRLPDAARQASRGMREFNKFRDALTTDVRKYIDLDGDDSPSQPALDAEHPPQVTSEPRSSVRAPTRYRPPARS
jgi:Sec-independent protein translocase protein TatA